jgi:hypothetical protein
MSNIEPFTDLVYGQVIRADADGFWLRSEADRLDRYFAPPGGYPAVLEGHSVTVIVSGPAVCLVANHATAQKLFYRPLSPEGPYLPVPKGGCSSFVLYSCAFVCVVSVAAGFASGLSGFGTFIILSAGFGLFVLVVLIRYQQQSYREAVAHNEQLDRQLERLADVSGLKDRPNRFRAL